MVRRSKAPQTLHGMPSVSVGSPNVNEIMATGPNLMVARKPQDKMRFEDMIGAGENPRGFEAQTPNGTAHAMGTGWNRRGPDTASELEPDPTRPLGRNNRTGE